MARGGRGEGGRRFNGVAIAGGKSGQSHVANMCARDSSPGCCMFYAHRVSDDQVLNHRPSPPLPASWPTGTDRHCFARWLDYYSIARARAFPRVLASFRTERIQLRNVKERFRRKLSNGRRRLVRESAPRARAARRGAEGTPTTPRSAEFSRVARALLAPPVLVMHH